MTMSSFPSLSQSMKPTPPLMLSMMYFFSGVEMCSTVKPARFVTSSKRGVCPSAMPVHAKHKPPRSAGLAANIRLLKYDDMRLLIKVAVKPPEDARSLCYPAVVGDFCTVSLAAGEQRHSRDRSVPDSDKYRNPERPPDNSVREGAHWPKPNG